MTILEMVARSGRGMSLSAISQQLGAPKSSVQELTNGLVATGYLVEHDGKLSLGAAPFVLTLMGNRMAALGLRHEVLERIHQQIGHSVLVGVGVGDSVVYLDQLGDSPVLEFVARNHSRRSLYATASGKIVLSELPAKEMDAFLLAAPASESADVAAFLAELPKIRSTRLAYNLGATVPDSVAVATPLMDSAGTFIASICVAADRSLQGDIERIGEQLRDAVAGLAF